jgi:hypothetical protein
VTDDLELLIAAMARHQAHHQIRGLVTEAREDYRAAGAPYGDDDQGFCRWFLARPRLTTAAQGSALGASLLANCPILPLVVHYSAAQKEHIYRTNWRPGHGTVSA